ncbi:MAG: MFS transporter, partial [Burkholderiaceae bacterium]
MTVSSASLPERPGPSKASFGVLGALSTSHMINDMMQSLILAMYPILKGDFHLSFAQVGLITLTYQMTASLLQPLIGLFTDRRPQPYSLPFGMCSTLCGLLLLAYAPNFGMVLVAAAFVGMGSAIFHPESSRIARLASGGKHGLAQSVFQVGGNTGTAVGPLLAAAIIVPFGQRSVAFFGLAALLGIVLLLQVSRWYSSHHVVPAARRTRPAPIASPFPHKVIRNAVLVLLVLIFSKYFYIAGLSSFYTFYLIEKFGMSVQGAQLHLFLFLFASAVGTLIGGPVGDRIGRKPVIWASILGVAPFALMLPYANLFWTTTFTILIGLVLSSAFSAILVYAQELMPGKIGMVSGLFFGFAFGMGGLGAAVL